MEWNLEILEAKIRKELGELQFENISVKDGKISVKSYPWIHNYLGGKEWFEKTLRAYRLLYSWFYKNPESFDLLKNRSIKLLLVIFKFYNIIKDAPILIYGIFRELLNEFGVSPHSEIGQKEHYK